MTIQSLSVATVLCVALTTSVYAQEKLPEMPPGADKGGTTITDDVSGTFCANWPGGCKGSNKGDRDSDGGKTDMKPKPKDAPEEQEEAEVD